MKFITVNRIEPIQFSIAFVLFKFCIQRCKCARKEYIEKDGKCFKNSTEISNVSKAVSYNFCKFCIIKFTNLVRFIQNFKIYSLRNKQMILLFSLKYRFCHKFRK